MQGFLVELKYRSWVSGLLAKLYLYLRDPRLARKTNLFKDISVSISKHEEFLWHMSAFLHYQTHAAAYMQCVGLNMRWWFPFQELGLELAGMRVDMVVQTLYPFRSRALWTIRNARWIGGCGTTIPSFSNQPNAVCSPPPRRAG